MCMKKKNVAILGASGAVGQMVLQVLEQRQFPIKNLRFLASECSAGKILVFQGREIVIEKVEENF